MSWKRIEDRNFPDARALLDEARKLDPEDARVPSFMGMILRDEGKADEAAIQFKIALASRKPPAS